MAVDYRPARGVVGVAKIKGFGNLMAYQLHANRENEPANANEELSHLNWTLRGNANDVVGDLKKFMEERDLHIKGAGTKNESVLCTELMLSASPTLFYECEKNEEGLFKYIDGEPCFIKDSEGNRIPIEGATEKFIMHNHNFLKEKYGDNYIFGIAHLDESTPHLSAIVCATNKNKINGKEALAHKAWFGKKVDKKNNIYINKLEDLHTEYAEHNKEIFPNIERGKNKTPVKAQTIRDYYANLSERKKKELEYKQEKANEIERLKEENHMTKLTAAKEIQANQNVLKKLAKELEIERALPKMLQDERDKINGVNKRESDNSQELSL